MAEQMTVVDPMAHQKIVGATFAKAEYRPLVVIGKRQWNKWQLGRIGCPHPSAAVKVNNMIQVLGIKTPSEFVERAQEFGGFKGLGVTAYWVALAIAQECGGDIDDVHGERASFHTVHRVALKRDGVITTNGHGKRKRRRRGY